MIKARVIGSSCQSSLEQLQSAQIIFSPLSLDFDHRFKRFCFERAACVKGDRTRRPSEW